jgi:hypothetical protein
MALKLGLPVAIAHLTQLLGCPVCVGPGGVGEVGDGVEDAVSSGSPGIVVETQYL